MTRRTTPKRADIEHARRDPRLHAAAAANSDDATWRTRARCQLVDPEMFFPMPTDLRGIDDAQAICATCPVQPDCLATALNKSFHDGVWGGTTEKERRAMLVVWREWQAAVTPVIP